MIELDDTIVGVSFKAHKDFASLDRAVVRGLVESGLWPAIRRRPYEKVPAIDSIPHSIS